MTDFDSTLLSMGDEKFVRLTTFRKTGVPVHTAVWIARDGDRLLVTTGSDSGKVKRMRHTQRVELTPCDRAGKVADGAPSAAGMSVVDPSAATRLRLNEVLGAKYGMQYRILRLVTKLRGSDTTVSIVIRPV